MIDRASGYRAVVWRTALTLALSVWTTGLAADGDGSEPISTAGQKLTGDADKQQTIAKLIRKLDADDRSERDDAQKRLLEFGPPILQQLRDATSHQLSLEQRQRLEAITRELSLQSLKSQLAGRSIHVYGKETVGAILDEIHRQSGYAITPIADDLRERPIRLPDQTMTFWQVLTAVEQTIGHRFYYAQDIRRFTAVPRATGAGPLSLQGSCRARMSRVALQRHFEARPEATCVMDISLAFEPTLKPLVLEVVTKEDTVADGAGKVLSWIGATSLELPVAEASVGTDFTLRCESPDRSSRTLKSVAFSLMVTLPERIEEVVFDDLTSTKKIRKAAGKRTVELRTVMNEDGVWTIPVGIIGEPHQAGLESYQTLNVEYDIFLRSPSGERVDRNGGLSTVTDGRETVIEHVFTDIPGNLADYQLVILLPVGIAKITLPMKFENVMLP